MARKTGVDHGDMLYSADGYMTAWFMWQHQGDSEAAKAFTASSPDIMSNKLYANQKISMK